VGGFSELTTELRRETLAGCQHENLEHNCDQKKKNAISKGENSRKYLQQTQQTRD
jgi:hypothetical protein